MRRPVVTVTLVLRTCALCGRSGYDVAPWREGEAPRCWHSTGCHAKALSASRAA